mmetsp:Transcript_22742/g.26722  ORF Transcript_22742/g.26722 Transcript_22742/m.26722 type:complete len:1455 (-) Transcript_22742:383-4747(-)|eukprot:CAMPEP_0114381198 /NCGR_PEP_ID=MMETSP0102-20121206/3311_1 /TAXON_ID=38822 ORGANISM="Pteridomonas danica, Strain PT" /NCGR_SAMPLE_ID=MMETSP0102 /ASSEMBLY_ACC=CAM_ASM_000212 /LENGTH=1454 /DNA_ID=CAMNT_0001536643 /DNA_START=66 /DNA_END=4430 /DNA_ORIENTATION=-
MSRRRSSMVKLGAGFNVSMAVKGASNDFSTKVWFKNPNTSLWCLGTVVRPGDDGNVSVQEIGSNVLVEVSEASTFAHNPSHDEYHSNISDIDDLHEAPLLDLLRRRHAQGDIYTYSNFVLMCVNPHRDVAGLYDGAPGVHVLEKNYPPHVHVIAQRAYTELNTGKSIEGGGIERTEAYHSQAILISGESGAGKTQASKQVIRYLAALSTSGASNSAELVAIEKALVSCSPLLEALGNSTTRMNHNSSRFGRLTRILFTDGSPSLIYGAKIENFLLEKPRVTARTPNERTFHAFYQLLKLDDICQQYGLSQSLIDHHYLSCGRGDVKTINDKENAHEWLESMNLCLGETNKTLCLDVVAAILHMGNIQVDEENDESLLLDSEALTRATELLGIPISEFKRAVCSKSVVVNGQTFTTPLTELQAMSNRDSIAKAVYGWMFDWAILTINSSIDVAAAAVVKSLGGAEKIAGSARSIAILDIYGFEVMENNSLEQLLINLANENLQQIFNDRVLLSEQEMYSAAGISVDLSDAMLDDSETLQLLVSKRGILRCLDDQNKSGIGTDKQFLASVYKIHGESPKLEKPKKFNEHFIIKHYAGDVMYDSVKCVDKNADALSADCIKVLGESTVVKLSEYFVVLGQTKKLGTISQRFLVQLDVLMGSLRAARNHYIRCIRPNQKASATEFNGPLVLKQLRYFGIMEVVRIRRAGFPERKPMQEFIAAYAILYPRKQVPQSPANMLGGAPAGTVQEEELRGQCRSLFSKAGALNEPEKRTGNKTKSRVRRQSMFGASVIGPSVETRAQFGNDGCVWMKDGFLKWMDGAVSAYLDLFATKIQSIALGFLAKRHYRKALASIQLIQSVGRTCCPKRKLKIAKRAATLIASTARRCAARKKVAWAREERRREIAAIKIASIARRCAARRFVNRIREDRLRTLVATKIASVARRFAARRFVNKLREERLRTLAATKIASCARRKAAVSFVAHKRANRSSVAVTLIATNWRRHNQSAVYRKERSRVMRVQCLARKNQATNDVAMRRKAYHKRRLDAAIIISCFARVSQAVCATKGLRRAKLEEKSSVKIQCLFRCLHAMNVVEIARDEHENNLQNACALGLQSIWQGFKVRKEFRVVFKLRYRWRRLLSDGELVVLSTPVAWHRGGIISSHKHVQLLVTSKRRILMIEESGGNLDIIKSMIWNGNCFVEVPSGSHALSGHKFTIVHDKKKVNFSALVGTAQRMKLCSRTLSSLDQLSDKPILEVFHKIAVYNVANGLENFPVEYQGFLKKGRVKKPDKSKKLAAVEEDSDDDGKEVEVTKKHGKVQERFFILQGNHLKYFAAGGVEPKGVLNMNPEKLQFGAGDNPMMNRASEAPSAHKHAKVISSTDGLSFTLILTSGHEIEATAVDTDDRDEWVNSLRSVLQTTHSIREKEQPDTRESLAFADMTADEKDTIEDNKRRIFRQSPRLF